MAVTPKLPKTAVKQTKTKSKRSDRRISLIVFGGLIAALVLLIFNQYLIGLVGYSYITGEGSRIGQVTKLSHKGVFWKTWEGTLSITQTGSYADNWNFSVDSHDPNKESEVAVLEQAADDGSIVKIDYEQHLGVRTWRGKTSYTITKITVLDPGQAQRRTILQVEPHFKDTP